MIYLSAYTAACKPLMHQLLYYTLRYIRLHIIIMWVRGTLLRCSTLSRWWSEMKKMSLCTRPRAVVRVRVRCGMRDDGRLLCSGKNNGPNLPASVLSPHDDDAFCKPAASIILLYRLILFVGIKFFFSFCFHRRRPFGRNFANDSSIIFITFNIPRKTHERASHANRFFAYAYLQI